MNALAGVNATSQDLCARARLLARHGEYAEAGRLLRLAINLDANCLEAYRWLEYALEAEERYDEAVAVHEWSRWRQVSIALYEKMGEIR